MLNIIFFFLFSAAADKEDELTSKKVIVQEMQCADESLRLHLSLALEPVNKKTLLPFQTIKPLIESFLYPSLGYDSLFKLLHVEQDPLAIYKFQKLMIQILADRTNQGCIRSNFELCRYLNSRYSTCVYDQALVTDLLEWRELLESKKVSVAAFEEREMFPAPQVTHSDSISQDGQFFLRFKSGIRDRALTNKELLEEFWKLPRPLQYAVLLESKGGGRRGFDTCIEHMCGFSLSSEIGQSATSGRVDRSQKLIHGDQSNASAGGWFGAIGHWLASFKSADGDTEALLKKAA